MKYATACDCHATDKKPLTRTEFREGVLKRDNNKCLFCDETNNLDAHHILERRLFKDCYGYHLDNGGSVCEIHHRMCESTEISCNEVREKAGIAKIVLPDNFYPDSQYTKWGDVILEDGRRMPGPYFYDESVQKVLMPFIEKYTKYVKYPRTLHHPKSESITADDKIHRDVESNFANKRVIVTLKMDGESFTGYSDYCHARSIDSPNHESRNWARTHHFTKIAYNMPESMRYCAENLFAKHTIQYKDLESYLYAFQIWNYNTCLSWEDTQIWFDLLDLTPVEVVYDGIYSEKAIETAFLIAKNKGHEGIVVRVADSFEYKDFGKSVCKLVRDKFHESGDHHWRHKRIVQNGLKDK